MKEENEKFYDEAQLFLYFIKNVKQHRMEVSKKTNAIIPISAICSEHDEKYKCKYCGCEYTYRKSLISHMKRLHNIHNID